VKLDWTKPEAAGGTALAYYKFNPDSGPSQTDYFFKSTSTTLASSTTSTSTTSVDAEFRLTGSGPAPPAYDYKVGPTR